MGSFSSKGQTCPFCFFWVIGRFHARDWLKTSEVKIPGIRDTLLSPFYTEGDISIFLLLSFSHFPAERLSSAAPPPKHPRSTELNGPGGEELSTPSSPAG